MRVAGFRAVRIQILMVDFIQLVKVGVLVMVFIGPNSLLISGHLMT
jgi:hypothetical protein